MIRSIGQTPNPYCYCEPVLFANTEDVLAAKRRKRGPAGLPKKYSGGPESTTLRARTKMKWHGLQTD